MKRPPRELTKRQSKTLGVIARWIVKKHRPPTYEELDAALAIRTRCGSRCHVEALLDKGMVVSNHGARGLDLTAQGWTWWGRSVRALATRGERVAKGV